MSSTTTSRVIDEIERLLRQDTPDLRGALALADAEVQRLNEQEARRTGRTVEEVDVDARARVIEACRRLWADEDAAEVARG